MYYIKHIEEITKTLQRLLKLPKLSFNEMAASQAFPLHYNQFLLKESIFTIAPSWPQPKLLSFPQIKTLFPTYYDEKKEYFSIN
ncbi:MAG TPA: hypothetical protein VHZ76_07090, partial [Gammaproteobacteria bacterium]|nr:hypothetical protein [Gammaproteobacteria bacterium]